MVLLTGVTGRVGRATAGALLNADVAFRALVRDPNKLSQIDPRMDVISGDLSDPQSVKRALAGVDRVLVVKGKPSGSGAP